MPAFDFSEYLTNPDGDYNTGLTRDGWNWMGVQYFEKIPVVIVIKNHELVGFRLPNKHLMIIPSEPSETFNPPSIKFPPLG